MKRSKTSISKFMSDDGLLEAHVMESEQNVLLIMYKESQIFSSKMFEKFQLEEAEADAEDYVNGNKIVDKF